jgi:hypothetical protein
MGTGVTSRRPRLLTLQELLTSQRESGPVRCTHCGRDSADRDHEVVQQALRVRIRVLEARIAELEAQIAGTLS